MQVATSRQSFKYSPIGNSGYACYIARQKALRYFSDADKRFLMIKKNQNRFCTIFYIVTSTSSSSNLSWFLRASLIYFYFEKRNSLFLLLRTCKNYCILVFPPLNIRAKCAEGFAAVILTSKNQEFRILAITHGQVDYANYFNFCLV